jgi:hypothetical protein
MLGCILQGLQDAVEAKEIWFRRLFRVPAQQSQFPLLPLGKLCKAGGRREPQVPT